MTIRTHGIVLLKRDFREHDRIYTIYTADFGKLELLGKATRKIISKLAGHLEPPALVDLFIVRGKIFDHIANVKMLESYQGIRSDLARSIAFAKTTRVFDEQVKLEEKDQNLYKFLSEFLEKLNLSPNLDGEPEARVALPTKSRILDKIGTAAALRARINGGSGSKLEIISEQFLRRLTGWTDHGIVPH